MRVRVKQERLQPREDGALEPEEPGPAVGDAGRDDLCARRGLAQRVHGAVVDPEEGGLGQVGVVGAGVVRQALHLVLAVGLVLCVRQGA